MIEKWIRVILLAAFLFSASTFSCAQSLAAAQERARKYQDERQKKKQENIEFLIRFRSLPPEERVNLWKQSNNLKYRKTIEYRTAGEIHDLLIMEGADTAPLLAAILHSKHESYFYRYYAMSILCDMDRFVPEADLPKGIRNTLGVKELHLEGAINPFLDITGRKIGKHGLEALQWTAEEADDKWLKFFTRLNLGYVKRDLDILPVDEQVHRWRELVAKSKGKDGRPQDFERRILADLIVVHAQQSLPLLLDILSHDKDVYVRTNTAGLVRSIDRNVFRLRSSDLGRSAIEAIHQAVVRGDFINKSACSSCGTIDGYWDYYSRQFFKDEFWMGPGTSELYSEWLNILYGENTIKHVHGFVDKTEPLPEYNMFLTYLTEKDPCFPSWEYIDPGYSYLEAFHPKFHIKMDRMDEAWKQFNAEKQNRF